MIKTSQTILAVDENPTTSELLKVIGDCKYNIEIENATSPEIGLERLKRDPLPSIVWSNSEFRNSNIDGRNFLKKCQKISPLSSRIICGSNLSNDVVEAMVSSSEIHSYYNSPLLYEVNPVLSSIQIGIEYHKVNLLKHFLDGLDINSISELEENLTTYSDIKKKTGWVFGLKRNWIDFENRNLELTQLSKNTQSVLKKIAKTNSNLNYFANTLGGKKENEDAIAVLEKVQDRINFIETFLTHSKNHLKNSLAHVAKTNINIANTKDKIKKLKDEFFDK
jgi:hypothetical protein